MKQEKVHSGLIAFSVLLHLVCAKMCIQCCLSKQSFLSCQHFHHEGFPKFSWVPWRSLEFPGGPWNTLEYPGVCSSSLEFSRVPFEFLWVLLSSLVFPFPMSSLEFPVSSLVLSLGLFMFWNLYVKPMYLTLESLKMVLAKMGAIFCKFSPNGCSNRQTDGVLLQT